jgi:hypothetical protein
MAILLVTSERRLMNQLRFIFFVALAFVHSLLHLTLQTCGLKLYLLSLPKWLKANQPSLLIEDA